MNNFSSRFNKSVSSDISGESLNTIVTSGCYYGNDCLDSPIDGHIEVIVTRYNENWIIQECSRKRKLFLRAYKNGRWYDWQDVRALAGDIYIEINEQGSAHTHDPVTNKANGFMTIEQLNKMKLQEELIEELKQTIVDIKNQINGHITED